MVEEGVPGGATSHVDAGKVSFIGVDVHIYGLPVLGLILNLGRHRQLVHGSDDGAVRGVAYARSIPPPSMKPWLEKCVK